MSTEGSAYSSACLTKPGTILGGRTERSRAGRATKDREDEDRLLEMLLDMDEEMLNQILKSKDATSTSLLKGLRARGFDQDSIKQLKMLREGGHKSEKKPSRTPRRTATDAVFSSAAANNYYQAIGYKMGISVTSNDTNDEVSSKNISWKGLKEVDSVDKSKAMSIGRSTGSSNSDESSVKSITSLQEILAFALKKGKSPEEVAEYLMNANKATKDLDKRRTEKLLAEALKKNMSPTEIANFLIKAELAKQREDEEKEKKEAQRIIAKALKEEKNASKQRKINEQLVNEALKRGGKTPAEIAAFLLDVEKEKKAEELAYRALKVCKSPKEIADYLMKTENENQIEDETRREQKSTENVKDALKKGKTLSGVAAYLLDSEKEKNPSVSENTKSSPPPVKSLDYHSLDDKLSTTSSVTNHLKSVPSIASVLSSECSIVTETAPDVNDSSSGEKKSSTSNLRGMNSFFSKKGGVVGVQDSPKKKAATPEMPKKVAVDKKAHGEAMLNDSQPQLYAKVMLHDGGGSKTSAPVNNLAVDSTKDSTTPSKENSVLSSECSIVTETAPDVNDSSSGEKKSSTSNLRGMNSFFSKKGGVVGVQDSPKKKVATPEMPKKVAVDKKAHGEAMLNDSQPQLYAKVMLHDGGGSKKSAPVNNLAVDSTKDSTTPSNENDCSEDGVALEDSMEEFSCEGVEVEYICPSRMNLASEGSNGKKLEITHIDTQEDSDVSLNDYEYTATIDSSLKKRTEVSKAESGMRELSPFKKNEVIREWNPDTGKKGVSKKSKIDLPPHVPSKVLPPSVPSRSLVSGPPLKAESFSVSADSSHLWDGIDEEGQAVKSKKGKLKRIMAFKKKPLSKKVLDDMTTKMAPKKVVDGKQISYEEDASAGTKDTEIQSGNSTESASLKTDYDKAIDDEQNSEWFMDGPVTSIHLVGSDLDSDDGVSLPSVLRRASKAKIWGEPSVNSDDESSAYYKGKYSVYSGDSVTVVDDDRGCIYALKDFALEAKGYKDEIALFTRDFHDFCVGKAASTEAGLKTLRGQASSMFGCGSGSADSLRGLSPEKMNHLAGIMQPKGGDDEQNEAVAIEIEAEMSGDHASQSLVRSRVNAWKNRKLHLSKLRKVSLSHI